MASAADTISITRAEYERLQLEHEQLQAECDRLQDIEQRLQRALATVEQLKRSNVKLSDELAAMIKKVFGRSSERVDPDQLALFEGALAAAERQAKQDAAPKSKSPKPTAGHGRPHFPEHLPREVIELDVPEGERGCADCGETMTVFGEEVTERGHIIPARMVVIRYVRKKYACPQGHGVKTPELPGTLIDKGKYEPSVYSNLAVAKYGDHLPLHRLSGIYKRHGFKLAKSTMWDLIERTDAIVAQPILAQMRSELLEAHHIWADETPVTVQLEDGRGTRQGYVWVYGSGGKTLFDFTMTRQRDGPLAFLGSWQGTLQTDGYSGYDKVTRDNRLVRVGCWSHARRKVLEAVERGSAEAVTLLRAIGRLFGIERALRARRDVRGLDDESWRELCDEVRGRLSQRVLAAIRDEVQRLWGLRSTLPKSALGKALTYLDNQWAPLAACLDDPDLNIHNNDAERALRHVVTGRKNWLFFGSEKGGQVGARLFSLIASCKALDIDPEAYLVDVIRAIDTTPASEIARLTPWGWAAEQQGG